MRPLIVTLLLLTLAACGPKPLVRNLGREPLPPPTASALPDRGCRLALAPVRDVRPLAERTGDGVTTIKVLVPLGLFFVSSTEGIEAADPDHLGGDALARDVEAGLRTLIERSGACTLVADAAQATHTLDVEIEHLYGLNAYRSTFWATYGAASRAATDFYPSGQAALSFALHTSEQTVKFRLAGASLFDPAATGSDARFAPSGVTPNQVENNRTQQVVTALGEVYARFPQSLDRALANLGQAAPLPLTGDTFVIVRQLADLEHVEQATIDHATGRVADVAIVRRTFPLVSAPGEWVVSPYQPAMLSAAAYQRLLDHLAARYVVTWGDNATAAQFGGLREAPSAAPVAAAAVTPAALAKPTPSAPATPPSPRKKKPHRAQRLAARLLGR